MTLLNVVDVEATCWEGEPPPGQHNEIIEIGLVVLNLHTLERTDKRSIMVRPEHSEISEFCTRLTGITAGEAASGLTFHEACHLLRREYHSDSRLWASWGDYDRKQFQSQFATPSVPGTPMPNRCTPRRTSSVVREWCGRSGTRDCPWRASITVGRTTPGISRR